MKINKHLYLRILLDIGLPFVLLYMIGAGVISGKYLYDYHPEYLVEKSYASHIYLSELTFAAILAGGSVSIFALIILPPLYYFLLYVWKASCQVFKGIGIAIAFYIRWL